MAPPMPDPEPPSDTDDAWVLLSRCELSASEAVRTRDLQLLTSVVADLEQVARSPIDTREVLLVGSLVRRAVEILGASWTEFAEQFRDDEATTRVLHQFPAAVSPVGHREVGSGDDFRFEKVPLVPDFDEEKLIRWLTGEEWTK